jgi:7-alpha-hydroxysteroid dehydrogenase
MTFSIAGKTAIVTGAANGVGLAIGQHFLDCGANVVFADIDDEGLSEQFGETSEGSNYRYFAGDLREKLTIANLLSTTMDAFERIDILVNASRQILTTDPTSADDQSVRTLLDQNLMTGLRLSQAVARRMIQQAEEDGLEGEAGAIVNLSNIAAKRCHEDLLGYSISVAALNQMTRSLAVSLARSRVRVNAVAFGSVLSASLQAQLKENPDAREEIISKTPIGRIANPDELVETVQFLASGASGFMTGQILTVDGGRSLLDPVHAPMH